MSTAVRNSQLRMLRECPHAYAEAYVRGTPGLPSPSLETGRAIHSAVQLAIQHVVESGMLDVHEVAFRAIRGGQAEYASCLEVLTRFQESLGVEWDIDARGVFLVEERLEMPLELPGGDVVTFFGTPDLGEKIGRSACRITDHKTHWRPESEAEFAADPQLRRYALLVHHNYPAFRQFELVKRFIRYSNAVHREVITVDDLDRVRRELITEVLDERRARAAGHFPATPGSWCSLCAHTATCPRIREYREHGIDDVSIADDERARQLAGDAVALDAAATRLKDQVKRYLGAEHPTGRVALAGGEFGYGPVQHRWVPVAALQEAFRSHGAELPQDVLAVDLDALDRLRRRLPQDLALAIDGITETWQRSQCRFRRISKTITTTREQEPEEALL